MGISTLASYTGAQTFQVIGLHQEVIDYAFCGMTSPVSGLNFADIADESLSRHHRAFSSDAKLTDEGYYRFRRDGELHAYSSAGHSELPHLCGD